MKKYFHFVLGLFLFLPLSALAFSFQSGGDISFQNPLEEDIYVAGRNITLETAVDGDFFAAAQTIMLEGDISYDAFLAGNSIILKGKVFDDLRILSGNVLIEGEIGGDVLIASGQVYITKDALIKGDLAIASGEVVLDGNILGDVYVGGGTTRVKGLIGGDAKVFSDQLSFEEGSRIAGDLFYRASEEIQNIEEMVSGEVTFRSLDKLSDKEESALIRWGIKKVIYNFLFLLIFGGLLYFSFEKFFRETGKELQEHPWQNLLKGFLYFLLLPILGILFLISVLGITIGFLSLAVFIFSLLLFELVGTTVFTGFFLQKYWPKEKNFWKKLGVLALVSFVFALVSGLDFIPALFAFGAWGTIEWKIAKSWR
ncbi:polymer-forming cytoskeletal protein [Candidatus Gracilibacteria bacterium]|nr:polymer-forming cytoskeletal protein [Candidatus Gracilibacteria bacterium]MCF7819803.1 polymer-forming cytoskeletal protein [Candidatus Gracilibacteria bacterium]